MAQANCGETTGTGRGDFRARMEDQCRHIQRYRRQVLQREQRRLTIEEAAREWIERHAASYAARHPH